MKIMGVREFIRGGYKEITEPVLVMSNSTPLGVWDPTATMPHFVSTWSNTVTNTSATFTTNATTSDVVKREPLDWDY